MNEPVLEDMEYIPWGTYGESGLSSLKYVKLGNCANDHLENILKTQPLNSLYEKAIKKILEDRAVHGTIIKETIIDEEFNKTCHVFSKCFTGLFRA